MKKVALFGIGGLYNFGCEGILRGCKKYINSMYPGCSITYYSIYYNYDKYICDDIGIGIVKVPQKISILKRIINKILRHLNINYQISIYDYSDMISSNEVFYSLGGDIYTIPDIIREHTNYRYYNPMVSIGKKIISHHKELIIFGASIGPFGPLRKAEKYYSSHLNQVTSIVCRELITFAYLQELLGNTSNCTFLPDPVFLVKEDKLIDESSQQYIGVNLSGLSIMETYESFAIGKEHITKMIEAIIAKNNMQVLLIPHVINSPYNNYDDDNLFLNQIYSCLNNETQKRVTIANPTSFLEAKKYIRKCRLIVAARMHCGVNALTENIPAIFLSYSKKSKGMCRFIYGDDKYCIDIREKTIDLNTIINDVLLSYDEIVERISIKNNDIVSQYNEYIQLMRNKDE